MLCFITHFYLERKLYFAHFTLLPYSYVIAYFVLKLTAFKKINLIFKKKYFAHYAILCFIVCKSVLCSFISCLEKALFFPPYSSLLNSEQSILCSVTSFLKKQKKKSFILLILFSFAYSLA